MGMRDGDEEGGIQWMRSERSRGEALAIVYCLLSWLLLLLKKGVWGGPLTPGWELAPASRHR